MFVEHILKMFVTFFLTFQLSIFGLDITSVLLLRNFELSTQVRFSRL